MRPSPMRCRGIEAHLRTLELVKLYQREQHVQFRPQPTLALGRAMVGEGDGGGDQPATRQFGDQMRRLFGPDAAEQGRSAPGRVPLAQMRDGEGIEDGKLGMARQNRAQLGHLACMGAGIPGQRHRRSGRDARQMRKVGVHRRKGFVRPEAQPPAPRFPPADQAGGRVGICHGRRRGGIEGHRGTWQTAGTA
ncbi:MAG TPA: hypothetical protein PKD10_19570 [Paracoccaceae bacterium]|nr:hypothetical protein [Paracoccaceae bacterium]